MNGLISDVTSIKSEINSIPGRRDCSVSRSAFSRLSRAHTVVCSGAAGDAPDSYISHTRRLWLWNTQFPRNGPVVPTEERHEGCARRLQPEKQGSRSPSERRGTPVADTKRVSPALPVREAAAWHLQRKLPTWGRSQTLGDAGARTRSPPHVAMVNIAAPGRRSLCLQNAARAFVANKSFWCI